jgi:TolB protein
MNANGSSPVNITNSPGWDGSPSWSPDGQSLVFASNRGGKEEIYTIGTDGTGLTRLTDNSATDAWPDWRP